MSRIILWLRNDLRLHDNYALTWALRHQAQSKQILPVFCFDPRYYVKEKSQTKYGTRKTGLIRSRFMLETVSKLRADLRDLGSNLILATEQPEDFIPKLLDQESENIVVYQQEICDEELKIEQALISSVNSMARKNSISASVESVWGSTLHHLDDMPYDPNEQLPHVYGRFRDKGSSVKVRELLPTP